MNPGTVVTPGKPMIETTRQMMFPQSGLKPRDKGSVCQEGIEVHGYLGGPHRVSLGRYAAMQVSERLRVGDRSRLREDLREEGINPVRFREKGL